MVISIGRKANLLHLRGLRLGLHFLFLLLLIVEEFIVIDDLTNRGIGLRGNFNEVKLLGLGHFHCFRGWIHSNRYVVSHQSYLWNPDVMIDPVFCFFTRDEPSSAKTTASRSKTSFVW